jgi:flagellar basal body P-ring formation protein FlgA
MFARLCLTTVLLAMPLTCLAQQVQDIEGIERQLIAKTGVPIGDSGGLSAPIDRRLRLSPCPTELTYDRSMANAIIVRCTSLGWRMRVALVGAGQGDVAHQPVVHRGDPVEIIAVIGNITVSSRAIAEQDGVVGGRIRVRSNTSTISKLMIVEVVGEGIVRLTGLN